MTAPLQPTVTSLQLHDYRNRMVQRFLFFNSRSHFFPVAILTTIGYDYSE